MLFVVAAEVVDRIVSSLLLVFCYVLGNMVVMRVHFLEAETVED